MSPRASVLRNGLRLAGYAGLLVPLHLGLMGINACEQDADGDGYTSDVDCDDTDASTWPGAPEQCDVKDNDCDRAVDEELVCVGDIDTWAGNGTAAYHGDGGPATAASLNLPNGLAVDVHDNLYIADTFNAVVRKVTPEGIISTVAGTGQHGSGGDGAPATNAGLSYPHGVGIDDQGYLFIADGGNNRVRRVNPSGTIVTFAGNGIAGYSGDGGPANRAMLKTPSGVVPDGLGNVYIADTGNHCVRKVDSAGVISTVTGLCGNGGYNGDNIPAVEAQLDYPAKVALDLEGNLHIADATNGRIRKVDADGIITTVAGIGTQGYAGDGGPATAAKLSFPSGIAFDAQGNLIIADTTNHRIRRVDPSGIITTIAGVGVKSFAGDNGPAVNAALNNPKDVAAGAWDHLYIADESNQRVRRILGTVPDLEPTPTPAPEPVDPTPTATPYP